jgi:glutamate formiminotransferase/formiminotetrahydrofolate cyclodeaminase
MDPIIECVPNFSEGRDPGIIGQITGEIESVEGVKLLDVDPGKATNRTVVTFVGTPQAVTEAAFRAVRKASRLIDMSKHKGEHPRFGATDVCPLVPVSGISMEEVVGHARKLAERIGTELGIPVYCYENAAFSAGRRNLADVRSGEYEGLKDKLEDPAWKPDFGPDTLNPRSGATAVGARDFLVAYNINLNTTSTRRANAIAFDIREKGRVKRKGHPLTGEIIRDDKGNPVMIPGSLKAVKAIGWYIEEYGIAQISVNLTNISLTSIHQLFDEACLKAAERGIRVTGSELVGLVPLKAMLDAGRHYLHKQQRSTGVSDKELIKIAVKSLGLDDLYPFKPEEKIIEYMIQNKDEQLLKKMSVEDFVFETASESPAPGGGSVSACMGALGAALGTMVANLSSHKRGWDERWKEFSDRAEQGKKCQEELLSLIDKDTAAFNAVMDAYSMPGSTDEERAKREASIETATKNAMKVPLRIMEVANEAMVLVRAMAETGNPGSVSDAGAGALALRASVSGAFLNVRINASGLKDREFAGSMVSKGKILEDRAEQSGKEILALVEKKL